VTSASSARTFEVRHLQLARAAFAALAALMLTFSPDHSAEVGLAVFSGFAIATGLIFALSAWLVFSAGRRWPAATLAFLSIAAGMASGIAPLRTNEMFFVVIVAWALSSGLVEGLAAWRSRKTEPARDGVTVGILGLVLGAGVLCVPVGYALDYYIEEAGRGFTLTGVTIAVGLFGGYAAIVAVYLAIAGLSPRRTAAPADAPEGVDA
jgi:uncharacterized membrane protein HdeD (DUF308 family)